MDIETPTTPTEIPLKTTKAVASFAATKSVSFVIAGAIKNVVPVASRNQQVQVIVGSYVLAGILAPKVTEFTNEKLDSAKASWDKFKAQRAEKSETIENTTAK